jgi:hypothetical protein
MAEVRATTDTYRSGNNGPSRVASGLNILAGIWVFISAWVFAGGGAGAVWNSIIVGILIVIFAAIRMSRSAPVWPAWLNVILGIWLIISPWIYGFALDSGRRTNDIIFGIVVIVLAIWSASTNRPEVLAP